MRRSPLRRKTPLKGRPRQTGPTPDVVDAVLERAAYNCEVCSVGVGDKRGTDYQLHHRRPRAMGGTDRPDTNWPSNLLLICPECHLDIETHRGVAVSQGWLVSQGGDPARTAVLLRRDTWRYLTPDGRYSITPPKEEDRCLS